MHTVARNRRTVSYKTYSSKTANVDANGYKTGEYTITYSALKTAELVISPARGYAELKPFGIGTEYELIAVSGNNIDLDEASVVWVYAETTAQYDYVVVAVRRSLNHTTYALKKVEVN